MKTKNIGTLVALSICGLLLISCATLSQAQENDDPVIPECDPPCQNGGNCTYVEVGSSETRCACPHGYGGELCGELEGIPEEEEEEEEGCEAHFPTKAGFIPLYLFALFYVFFAISHVTKYFLQSLHVMCEILHLSEDVAGATFLAAGTSIAELLAALIDTFITKSGVGPGTVIGSVVFNILCIIGGGGLIAPRVLAMDWRPFARDMFFWGVTMVAFTAVLWDREISWFDAAILVAIYAIYVGTMFVNPRLMAFLDKLTPYMGTYARDTALLIASESGDNELTEEKHEEPESGLNSEHHNEKLSHDGDDDEVKQVQLVVTSAEHTSDNGNINNDINTPSLCEECEVNPATSRCVTCQINLCDPDTEYHRRNKKTKEHRVFTLDEISQQPSLNDMIPNDEQTTGRDSDEVTVTVQLKMKKEEAEQMKGHFGGLLNKAVEPLVHLSHKAQIKAVQFSKSAEKLTLEVLDEIHEDLHALKSPYEWPHKPRQKIFHAIVFPVLIFTHFTIPNLNSWNPKRWWPLACFLALVWIIGLCFLMVELANAMGCILNISPVVMGLTVLAVGTSFPDFMSSLYSAKAGKGSMCIANCLGSNIFDINVCLGIPWLLNIFAPPFGQPLPMNEGGLNGQFIAMFLSFFLTAAACWKLRLAKPMGGFLLVIYVLYIIYVILFAYKFIPDFNV